ncbi:DeoR/GlpR family DNA-binding transcription regulator [Bacillus sp. FJAT-42315]|uniref:DeoR/GlpR family DNA-binding transcription regulator n=1 Tax=Bacillus sp. FJAT-42315 TaxID=2014077 RepID=UPI000C24244F|nr:DeoR/GlpR family DNA-binding transcription regulator [Bacillus sp. FJAT-42315]
MSTLQKERYVYILKEIESVGKIMVAEMAHQLQVTPETIRKDLDILEKEKKLKRVHGGAVKYGQTQKEAHFNKKMNDQYYQKREIGKKAAEIIEDNDTIMIDVGTTTVHIPEHIVGVQRLTVVTNSLAAADLLNKQIENRFFDGKVIVLGGVANPEQKSVAGTLTCHMLEHFQFDKAFISCGGITPQDISDFDLEESIVSAQMIKQTNEVVLLADCSKLGNKSFYKICPTKEVHSIICDQAMPAEWKQHKNLQHIKWIEAKGRGVI